MAFDFSKLKVRTPEERAEDDARREREMIEQDASERRSKIKHSRVISLSEDAEVRFTRTGDREIYMRGTDEQNRPLKARFVTPYGMDRNAQDDLLRSLTPGSKANLDGYFQPHKDNAGNTHFTMMVMTLGNDHTRQVEQQAWDRTRAERQAGEDAAAQRARSGETQLWDAEIKRRNAHEAEQAAAFGTFVRNTRDEILSLSGERREVADQRKAYETKAAEVLAGISKTLPNGFSGIAYQTMIDPRNEFLVVDLDARHSSDPYAHDTQIRRMGYSDEFGHLTARDMDDDQTGYGPVKPSSFDLNTPRDRDDFAWDDLRRSAEAVNPNRPGEQRFLALPYAGPVADEPGMKTAAAIARSIYVDGGETFTNLLEADKRLKTINAAIEERSDAVLNQAFAIDQRQPGGAFKQNAVELSQEIAWSRSFELHSDGLTTRTVGGRHEEASAVLNALPLASAITAYSAAKHPAGWVSMLDLPNPHPDLMRSNDSARSPRIELRGNADIDEIRRPGMSATTSFEAILRGEKSAVSDLAGPHTESGFESLKPGDRIRIHENKRSEMKPDPADNRYVDAMITSAPARMTADTTSGFAFELAARREGMTEEAFATRLEKRGGIVQLAIKVLETNAVARPHPIEAIRRRDTSQHER